MMEIITKQNLSSCEGAEVADGVWNKRVGGGSLHSGDYERRVCVCVCVCTVNKQCVHAWWRLGGLEHFGDILLRQRGLPSALPLGVLLLPPLEVLLGDSERGGIRERGRHRGKEREEIKKGRKKKYVIINWGRGKGRPTGKRNRARKMQRARKRRRWDVKKHGDERRDRRDRLRGVVSADRDGVICGGLTVGKSVRYRVPGEPKSLVNLERWRRDWRSPVEWRLQQKRRKKGVTWVLSTKHPTAHLCGWLKLTKKG